MTEGIVVLTAAAVARHLTPAVCRAAMELGFRAWAEGRVAQPQRPVVPVADRGSLYVMPGYIADGAAGSLAVKLVTLFPGNSRQGLETHNGAIVLFDAGTGRVLALIEAASVTALRTAAVSALATEHLALPEASELAVLGAGVQAKSHVAALLEVRPIRRVRVWSRSEAGARRFAEEACARHGLAVQACATAESAVRGAHVICTVTGASEPVLRGVWVSPGTHINAVGASTASARELDTELVARARVVVDSRAAALVEAGDILLPIAEGAIGPDHIAAELGDIVAGMAPGRERPDDVTVFESLGLAFEDVVAARLVYDRAIAAGLDPIAFG